MITDAVVAGAGVVGLTTAISLAEAGLSTRIVTTALPPQTTSVAAGAIWGPVRCGPPDRTYEWARTGLAVLSELAGEPVAGIRQVSGMEVTAEPRCGVNRVRGWCSSLGGITAGCPGSAQSSIANTSAA